MVLQQDLSLTTFSAMKFSIYANGETASSIMFFHAIQVVGEQVSEWIKTPVEVESHGLFFVNITLPLFVSGTIFFFFLIRKLG